jgi:hypothetical protein
MILKGKQRGSGQQLATQLLNADNNQRVEILELRGSVARDLHGAFEEWCACSMGTQCRKYLYSLSINPDPRQGGLTHAQLYLFCDGPQLLDSETFRPFVDFGSCEVGSGNSGSCEIGCGEINSGEVDSGEVRSLEDGPYEFGP